MLAAFEGGWAAAFAAVDQLALGSDILVEDAGWKNQVTSATGKTMLSTYQTFINCYFAGRALEAVGAFNKLKSSYTDWKAAKVVGTEVEVVEAKMAKIVGASGESTIYSTRKLQYRPSWKPDLIIKTNPNKTTTIIGSYEKDIQYILKEIDCPKSTNFGAKNGDFNLLNVPDNLYNPTTFWDDFNKPWLKAATERGDEIIVISNPMDNSLLVNNGYKTGFGKEIDFMNDLVSHGKYKFIATEGKYIPIK